MIAERIRSAEGDDEPRAAAVVGQEGSCGYVVGLSDPFSALELHGRVEKLCLVHPGDALN
jgi:hypothetical protein